MKSSSIPIPPFISREWFHTVGVHDPERVLEALRPESVVMAPENLRAIKVTRLSFAKSLVLQMARQRWQIALKVDEIDQNGKGTLVYEIRAEGTVFHFAVASQANGPIEKAGRFCESEYDFYGAILRAHGLAPYSFMQHHYNAVWREDERDLIPFCKSEGIGMLPYSPTARGFLAGRSRREQKTTERSRVDEYTWAWYGRPADEMVANAIEDAARELEMEPAQVALPWTLNRQPVACPIIGVTSVSHVDAAVATLSKAVDLEVFESIDQHYLTRPSGGHF